MVQKLVARIGRSTDIPVLLVGELGMDVDVLVARFGDGSPAAPRIMTDKSSGNFEYLSIEYVKYPQIQMVAGGTVDGVDISELNSANGFLIRNGNNSWSHRILTNTDGWFDILNGDGTVGNPVINASPTLIALLTTPYLTSVIHDSTLTGNGTVAVPLTVTAASITQLGGVSLATQAEVDAGLLTNKPVTPATLTGRVASETLTGLVELATQVEVDAGTDTVRALTPASLNNKTATDTRRGVVELATSAEVLAGTDSTRVITPAGLAAYFVANPSVAAASSAEVITGAVTNKYISPNTLVARTALTTRVGLIALATNAEVIAGTDSLKAITPASLANGFADSSKKASQVEVDAGSAVSKYVAPNTLAARTATTIRTGLVALATSAEVNAGTEATKAITSATLQARQSSETLTGLIELATSAEVIAGTDTVRSVTPAGLTAWYATKSMPVINTTTLPVGSIIQGAYRSGGVDTITQWNQTRVLSAGNRISTRDGFSASVIDTASAGTWRALNTSTGATGGAVEGLWQRIS